ncbi:MAG: tail fiber domain-containing protein [Myxococcales bacterium]|nr:tail fiber domain-containing protein [Myxococcales bacterium]
MTSRIGAGIVVIMALAGCPGGDDGGTGATTMSSSNTSTASSSATSADSGATTNVATSTGSGSASGGSEGSGSSSGPGSSGGQDSTGSPGTTGAACVEAMGSCAEGEACCEGLSCCTGVPVPPGEEYCDQQCPDSDYHLKRDFEVVDPDEVLAKVAALPITTWSYRREDPSVRHLGPMAQDFQASFGLGASDRSIFVVDADGVALSSIQALYRRLRAAEAENEALRDALADLQRRVQALEPS